MANPPTSTGVAAQPALMTIPEVGEELRVSRHTVYRYIHSGALPVVYVGEEGKRGNARVSRADLDDYIARKRRTTAA